MKTSTRYMILTLCCVALAVASARLAADEAPCAVVSAGAETDNATGSIQNAGQAVIGRAGGGAVTLSAGAIPCLAHAAATGLEGDLDGDGDVDLDDFSLFAACYNGANNPPSPNCPRGVDADLDDDGDVDLDDFAILATNYTGSQ